MQDRIREINRLFGELEPDNPFIITVNEPPKLWLTPKGKIEHYGWLNRAPKSAIGELTVRGFVGTPLTQDRLFPYVVGEIGPEFPVMGYSFTEAEILNSAAQHVGLSYKFDWLTGER